MHYTTPTTRSVIFQIRYPGCRRKNLPENDFVDRHVNFDIYVGGNTRFCPKFEHFCLVFVRKIFLPCGGISGQKYPYISMPIP